MRALVDHAHDVSATRNHVMQAMRGISHFYLQFGYEYTTVMPLARRVEQVPLVSQGHVGRVATAVDLPAAARRELHARH